MKKLSLLLLVITITANSFAQNNKMDITTVKTITTDEIVTSLKIYNNVEVLLTDTDLREIEIVGEKTAVEKTLVKVENGELTITGSPEEFFTEKVVVYVSSKNMSNVYIHGASFVSSNGILSNEMLNITINGQGKSFINTAGLLSINTIGDFPLEELSNEELIIEELFN